MRIAVLTSSRADYGIYLPLLKELQKDPFFDLRIIVFGTHLSSFHGHTVDVIQQDGFRIDHLVEHVLASDSAEAIASSMALAATKFTAVWQQEKNNYDLVLCLGDRYEMFAAVSAGTPFRVRFAHFHGGETTLGAIDNEFRHCITLFSSVHFVSTDAYANRVAELKGGRENIFVTGSLSLNNIKGQELLGAIEFQRRFGIDLSKSTVLVTFHPETVAEDKNELFALELMKALEQMHDHQVVITMPNADTKGNSMREVYQRSASAHPNIILVENLGTLGYFSCMKLSKLVVGNSSSGIIEAASFGKYVVDIGDRQKGRITSGNVIHCTANAGEILAACETAMRKGEYTGANVYYRENSVQEVISILKKCYA
jgi:GDP/UDP-N,N'-diacetylbacillosamine 2-epimerase (hydrolysing)